jgi:hypothetical protein
MITKNTIHAEPGAKPPRNAQDIGAWTDCKADTAVGRFLVKDDNNDGRTITVSKNKRRVLESLIRGPVMAASRCRISDQVLPLRRDYGLDIVCTIYKNDPKTERQIYGVYTLNSKVTRIDGGAS